MTLAALRKGDVVVATCRKGVDRISKLKDAGAITLELDMGASVEVINEFVQKVLEEPEVKARGGVDILVNNAGYVSFGTLEEFSMEELKASFDTNFFGHVALTRAFLPEFRKRKAGTIAFLGSHVAFMNPPASILYSATKYALAGLAECLAVEVEPFNIRVICIEPGSFRTKVLKSTNLKKPLNGEMAEYKPTIIEWIRRNHSDGPVQPGDPVKGSQRIVDLLRGDWQNAERGTKTPVRLALGDDAYRNVEERYNLRLKENSEWRDWICGCDYD